jgi:protein-disulfide isomerase
MEGGRGQRPGVVKKTPSRAQAAAAKRKNQNTTRVFYLLLALIAVGGIGYLSYLSTRKTQATFVTSPIDTTLPRVESEGYLMGSPTAPVEVMELGDFECPGCAQFNAVTEPDVRARLVQPGTVRFRYVDFPLSMHRNTWNASRAAACADEQGKFWEMHDLLFQTQVRWNGEATGNPDKVFKDLGKQLGLNQKQFNDCIDTKKYQAKIQAHERIAASRKATGTPTFFVGGLQLTSKPTYDAIKQLVDSALKKSGTPINAGGGSDTAAGKKAAASKAPARP